MKRALTFVFLTLIIAVSSSRLTGQDFLVTTKGDTLQGEIKPLSYGTDKKVQVTQAGKKKITYSLFQVKSYSIKGETFLPVKGPNGYTFMKLVKSGYLSVYTFQSSNQINFDGTFLLKKDGQGVELPNISFEKVMKKFLDDCPEVTDKIERDELNKKDLDKIVDQYNSCVQNRSVNHQAVIATRVERSKSITAWDVLENKIKNQPEFEAKNNALEMVAEIKSKISTSQKIPNFLLEGLKSSLSSDVFKTELENALKEVN
jgi:hypothetical protein